MVQKKNELSPFSRDKLFISLYESCKHRSSAVSDATALSQTIISKLLASGAENGVIAIESIREQSIKALQRFDTAAATYYTAYYRK